ncbi:MAG TPA: C40 family peptidase [Gemmatimonadales bacterium]|nr:C40 family peptidase [Gemmatimonadales bacterium]
MRAEAERGESGVNAVICRSTIAPLHATPGVRTEQVSQLVLGETAAVLAEEGQWLRVRTSADSYEGWLHRGYAVPCDAEAARTWSCEATGWSEGAELEAAGASRRLPLRSRVVVEDGRVRLPDGTTATLVQGEVRPIAVVRRAAVLDSPDRWAARAFAGAPYEWGGVTEFGVDCSGLVQTTFAARGVTLPRDSADQARLGTAVPLEQVRPGDLLFFSETGANITHVAFAGTGGTLVHSTIACGGVVVEPWGPRDRAAVLRPQFVAARRIDTPPPA